MKNPTIRIHNTETDEIIDREMTDDELAKYKTQKSDAIAIVSEAEAKVAAKQAIAERLGLTADELQVLLG